MRYLIPIAAAIVMSSPAFAELRTSPYRKAYCTVWEHKDMQGASLRVPNEDHVTFDDSNVGDSNWRQLPRWNDRISSATVDPRCRLTVYEHARAEGRSRSWDGKQNGWRITYVGDSWNDRISSATCSCNR